MPKDRAPVSPETIWPTPRGDSAGVPGAQPIGRILVGAGRLSATDAMRVLQVSNREKTPFGETALRMGLVARDDIRFALARQFSLPQLAPDDESLSREVLAAYSENHPTVEQLRGLRSQIIELSSSSTRTHPMVAVLSSNRGDGRSFVAANLAVLFAQLRVRTLLIDADLRNPSQHRHFKLENRLGLSSILAGRTGTEVVHVVPSLPQLYVLTAGAIPPNPLELLSQPTFKLVLEAADAEFKAIVIDTPAADQGADGRVIACSVGSGVLIARVDNTSVALTAKFVQELLWLNARLLGVVYNANRAPVNGKTSKKEIE